MTDDSPGSGPQPLTETDTTVPHSARIWNYWPEQIATFFDGLDVVAPGLVPLQRWRPAPEQSSSGPDLDNFGGVARK
jgi:hypothetical protein